MNKRNTELFAQIKLELVNHKAPAGLEDAIRDLLETTTTAGPTNPNKFIDGLEYKYCTRHHQYESIEGANFRAKKDGSLWPTCQVAYETYVAYGKQINAKRKLLNDIISGAKEGDIAEVATEINKLEIDRKAKDVAYDRAGTEGYALPDENIEKEGAQKPKRGKK